MNQNYRLDNRDEASFKRQIEERTLLERQLFFKWLDYLEKEKGYKPKFQETSCGIAGEYLENEKVNSKADFLVDEYGPIEVKYSSPLLDKFFHLKETQVKSYIKQKASIIMVNGAKTEQTSFTLLTPSVLCDIVNKCEIVLFQGFAGKPSYKIPVNKFIWRPL